MKNQSTRGGPNRNQGRHKKLSNPERVTIILERGTREKLAARYNKDGETWQDKVRELIEQSLT